MERNGNNQTNNQDFCNLSQLILSAFNEEINNIDETDDELLNHFRDIDDSNDNMQYFFDLCDELSDFDAHIGLNSEEMPTHSECTNTNNETTPDAKGPYDRFDSTAVQLHTINNSSLGNNEALIQNCDLVTFETDMPESPIFPKNNQQESLRNQPSISENQMLPSELINICNEIDLELKKSNDRLAYDFDYLHVTQNANCADDDQAVLQNYDQWNHQASLRIHPIIAEDNLRQPVLPYFDNEKPIFAMDRSASCCTTKNGSRTDISLHEFHTSNVQNNQSILVTYQGHKLEGNEFSGVNNKENRLNLDLTLMLNAPQNENAVANIPQDEIDRQLLFGKNTKEMSRKGHIGNATHYFTNTETAQNERFLLDDIHSVNNSQDCLLYSGSRNAQETIEENTIDYMRYGCTTETSENAFTWNYKITLGHHEQSSDKMIYFPGTPEFSEQFSVDSTNAAARNLLSNEKEKISPEKGESIHCKPKQKRQFLTKTFDCSICRKEFSSKNELKKHMLIHTKEKPYKCNFCQKAFNRKDSLKTHTRIHTGEKPFKCVQCEKSFSNSSDLAKHKLTHSDERPFVCDICRKAFKRLDHLKSHSFTHMNEKQFKCDFCGQVFTHKHSVKCHVATFHKSNEGKM